MRLHFPHVCAIAAVFPNDVEQDLLKIWIAIVAVGAPAASAQVYFNVPGARGIRADLQHCPAKVRAAFQVGEARMKHAHAFAGNGFEFAALEPLMLPDGLDEPFRRKPLIAQTIFRAVTRPPMGIKVVGELNQADCFWNFGGKKST